jgi:mono/diheme cytochrome c family protein
MPVRILLVLIGLLLAACGEAELPTVTPPLADAQELAWQKASHDPARIERGRKIYHGQAAAGACLTCHRPDGLGREDGVPSLRDDRWKHGSRMGDMISLIRRGEGRMPAVTVRELDDEALLDLVCYLADRNRREKDHENGYRIAGEQRYPIDY